MTRWFVICHLLYFTFYNILQRIPDGFSASIWGFPSTNIHQYPTPDLGILNSKSRPSICFRAKSRGTPKLHPDTAWHPIFIAVTIILQGLILSRLWCPALMSQAMDPVTGEGLMSAGEMCFLCWNIMESGAQTIAKLPHRISEKNYIAFQWQSERVRTIVTWDYKPTSISWGPHIVEIVQYVCQESDDPSPIDRSLSCFIRLIHHSNRFSQSSHVACEMDFKWFNPLKFVAR